MLKNKALFSVTSKNLWAVSFYSTVCTRDLHRSKDDSPCDFKCNRFQHNGNWSLDKRLEFQILHVTMNSPQVRIPGFNLNLAFDAKKNSETDDK